MASLSGGNEHSPIFVGTLRYHNMIHQPIIVASSGRVGLESNLPHCVAQYCNLQLFKSDAPNPIMPNSVPRSSINQATPPPLADLLSHGEVAMSDITAGIQMEIFISWSWPSVLIACILLTIAVLLRSKSVRKTSKLPPGPGGLPWIGQAFEIPMLHSHLYYTKLHKKLGDIYSLVAMGQKFVVLNTYEAAFEILGRQGLVHCERPANPYMRRFLGQENVIVLINANKDWKEGRRLYQMVFNKESSRVEYSKDIAAQLQSYIIHAIERVEDKGNKMLDIALHKILVQSTYGLDLADDDPILENALNATEVSSESLLPTKHLVNIFPSLQYLPAWVPFQTWRTEAKVARQVLDPMIETPWRHFLTNHANGTAKHSVALRIMGEQTPSNSHLLFTLAATNLFAEFLSWRCYFTLKRRRRLRRSSIASLGVNGYPRLTNLPYLDAVMKEVLRWRPVVPLSVPTTPIRDDFYRDYLIPQGAIVIQNNWAISRDERMYPNPDSFDPNRWLVANPPKDSRLWSFGIGRRSPSLRICPAIAYAEVVYATFFMTILATVDILPALDEDGNEQQVRNFSTTGRFVE
ncbi:cytochrome P450 [Clavulina sp. PMI_390]|nr:cytochrome P450 [Clavulina sp. PMI_390]